MAIPRDFINELVARTDIVEHIDSKVPLKKAGKNHSACCPFHSEKSPSFTVSQDKQFYHCFGCGAHGNIIDFIMEYERLDFVDAIEELAGSLGLAVPKTQGKTAPKDRQVSEDLYQLMESAKHHYQQQLKQHQDRHKVIDYLQMRDLSNEVVSQFGIGFAPDGWDGLSSQYPGGAVQDKLLNAGMLISNDNGRRYDRFRDRLMFPIHDRRGRVVGFGGRVLSSEGTPKYLNSPETPIFHKGNELYGLWEVRQRHRNLQRVLLVEGYMDVVALAQFGIDYAVAALGTATTAEQFQTVLRSSKELICCYDGDAAGSKAAWRALETLLPLLKPHHVVKFMFLPQGEDPDSMVRQVGSEAFIQSIDEAQSLADFLFATLTTEHATNKGLLAKEGMNLIEKIQDPILQSLLLDTLAHKLGKDSGDNLKKQLGFTQKPQVKKAGHGGVNGRGTPLRLALALILQHPQLGVGLSPQPALLHIQMPGVDLLIQLLELTAGQSLSSGQLLEQLRQHPQNRVLKKLAAWDHQISEDNISAEFKIALIWLNNQYIEQHYQALSLKVNHTKAEKIQLKKLIGIIKSRT